MRLQWRYSGIHDLLDEIVSEDGLWIYDVGRNYIFLIIKFLSIAVAVAMDY